METAIDISKYKTVVVHHTTDGSQPPHLIIRANGIQHPVLRGQPTCLNSEAYEVLLAAREAYPFSLLQNIYNRH